MARYIYIPRDPSRPHYWRWQWAETLRPRQRVEDSWVARAVLHRTRRPDASIETAHAIWTESDIGGTGRQTVIEAYVLARVPNSRIAKHMEIDIEAVEAYRALFYDIDEYLPFRDCVISRLLRGGPMFYFGGSLGTAVRYIAYREGEIPAAICLAVIRGEPVPMWVPDQHDFDAPLIRAKFLLLLASLTASSDSKFSKILRMKRDIQQLESALGGSRTDDDPLMALQKRFLGSMASPTVAKPKQQKREGRDPTQSEVQGDEQGDTRRSPSAKKSATSRRRKTQPSVEQGSDGKGSAETS